ncbi:putative Spindle assembly checkpoint kinase [Blattamonas nauphoetae]|uniref:Aurora kinase n=1 Tax=Blattamonas nauphoetae TaxID=2049346 RepID=A0ABQ9YHX5_9EUKA|nr:putative Spindle assembly checkpoint kinase [Blattamonas nauphoetae]
MSNQSGWSMNHFEIGTQMGEGQYGRVYSVREKEEKFVCALKCLDKERLLKYHSETLVVHEIEIMMSLKHDNIIKCYGYFHDEKTIYIIMELAPDGELYHRLTQKRGFPEHEAANYLVQIAHALQYLHEKGIIHRDLKPENILLGREGKLKLSDFGCSAFTPQGTRKTFCGTTEYIPPEMFQYKEYSFSADIWSFGILVYELVCGITPFFHEEAKQIQAAVIKGRFNVPDRVSPEFKDLVEKILVLDPTMRPSWQKILQHPWFLRHCPSAAFGLQLQRPLSQTQTESSRISERENHPHLLQTNSIQRLNKGLSQGNHNPSVVIRF